MNETTQPSSYHEVIKEIEESKQECHLLLGKDFTNSLGLKTDYESIVNQMLKSETSFSEIQQYIEDNDFDIDKVLIELKKLVKVHSDESIFLEQFIEKKVETDFMKAASQVARDIVKEGAPIEDKKGYFLFNKFNKYFQLNYNISCFTLLMRLKENMIVEIQTLVFLNTSIFRDDEIDDQFQEIYQKIEESYDSGKLDVYIDKSPGSTSTSAMKKEELRLTVGLYFKKQKPKWKAKTIESASDKVWDKKHKKANEELEDKDLFGSENNNSSQDFFSLSENFSDSEDIVNQFDMKQFTNLCCTKIVNLEGCMIILGGTHLEKDKKMHQAIMNSKVTKVFVYYNGKQKSAKLKKVKKVFEGKQVVLFDFSK